VRSFIAKVFDVVRQQDELVAESDSCNDHVTEIETNALAAMIALELAS
jgi:hypothetical protein